MTENNDQLIAENNNQHLVFIIDGQVVHRLATDDKFAAVLLSDPIIKDITDLPNKDNISLGAIYNEQTDSFTPYKPFESWVWNESSKAWQPPIEFPSSSEPKAWTWAEDIQNWAEVPLDAANIEYLPPQQ